MKVILESGKVIGSISGIDSLRESVILLIKPPPILMASLDDVHNPIETITLPIRRWLPPSRIASVGLYVVVAESVEQMKRVSNFISFRSKDFLNKG